MEVVGEEYSKEHLKNVKILKRSIWMYKYFDIDSRKPTFYNDEYTSLLKRKCKCGHAVTIYSRKRREICRYCGSYVYLTPKDEFIHQMKRKVGL